MKCINIDWLECYCLEDTLSYPHNADFFRKAGWQVQERDYGTPVYHEMFTLVGYDGEKWIEVRRKPKSDFNNGGIFDPCACHIRLTNRSCYFSEPAKMLAQFLERYGFEFKRISRIDICLDFERFDYGDEPAKFLKRYLNGKYSKVNQANINAHGTDAWDERTWQSVSWGAKKSMVRTRFYNKTLELKQVKDKPYIRQAWRACGLVEDEMSLTKRDKQGNIYSPQIYRVEFAITSGTARWFIIEGYGCGTPKRRSLHNTLDDYFTRGQLLDRFYSLADHYFHFKKYVAGQRKDRCPDKLLFNTSQAVNFYHVEHVATAEPRRSALDKLLQRLIDYRDTHGKPDVYKAANILIEEIENETHLNQLTIPWNMDEVQAMRLLVAKRMKDSSRPLSLDIEEAKAIVAIERELWTHPRPINEL